MAGVDGRPGACVDTYGFLFLLLHVVFSLNLSKYDFGEHSNAACQSFDAKTQFMIVVSFFVCRSIAVIGSWNSKPSY